MVPLVKFREVPYSPKRCSKRLQKVAMHMSFGYNIVTINLVSFHVVAPLGLINIPNT